MIDQNSFSPNSRSISFDMSKSRIDTTWATLFINKGLQTLCNLHIFCNWNHGKTGALFKKHHHNDERSLVFSRFKAYKTLEDAMFIKKQNQPIGNSNFYLFIYWFIFLFSCKNIEGANF